MAWSDILERINRPPCCGRTFRVPPTPNPTDAQTPFASQDDRSRSTVGLWTLLISMVVFAAISFLLMFAARVPAISESINDMFGIRSSTNGTDKPDRSAHLFMLLFCYTSPLMLMLWVSLLKGLGQRRSRQPAKSSSTNSSDPFA